MRFTNGEKASGIQRKQTRPYKSITTVGAILRFGAAGKSRIACVTEMQSLSLRVPEGLRLLPVRPHNLFSFSQVRLKYDSGRTYNHQVIGYEVFGTLRFSSELHSKADL